MTEERIIALVMQGDMSQDEGFKRIDLLGAVKKQMFCPLTKRCLDVTSALLVTYKHEGKEGMAGPYDPSVREHVNNTVQTLSEELEDVVIIDGAELGGWH